MRTINNFSKPVLIAAAALSVLAGNAREKQGMVFKAANTQKVMAACNPAQTAAELSVNNVRTIIYSGSDMWWDLFGSGNARYAVPKVENWAAAINSNFAGNVWFGGLDVNNNLKIAAQTYRQAGIDFWTGPLSTVDGTTTSDVCNAYDKIFHLSRKEVTDYVFGTGSLTDEIKNWPGNGDVTLNHDPQLAPYVDVDNDGYYNPANKDYPYYDVYGKAELNTDGTCKAKVYGDETLWWVYNDNGNVHQATGGAAIGMEVRAQAFAFKTTDDVNNMTFYNYQIINRSAATLFNTYMTVWTDADLGYYSDDYIGCDVGRGLGYIYNGDANDETAGGVNGYGASTPALGCDFFQGPINTMDGVDNDNDGLTDEAGEQMGMTKFLYFNNSLPGTPPQTTDPENAQQYYQYMTGFWKDGTPFTCGGNAYGGTIGTNYVFTASTFTTAANPCGPANWDESGVPGDRRFMQSAGPFTLLPGAVNYVTVGLPWSKATVSGDPKSAIEGLKVADDKAQALFDKCFEVLSGPEAPDLTIQELNNELIIYLTNKPGSNNYLTKYQEEDKTIAIIPGHYPDDKWYRFEGYKVYQLKNSSVSVDDLEDGTKAQLVFQCDVKNGVDRLVNFEYDNSIGGDVAKVKVEKTENSDKGIQSSFRFTRDRFSSTSEQKVVNNKTYYFLAVAYGYNEFGKYKEDSPWIDASSASSEGQKIVYLQGRRTKQAYGIPHDPTPEKFGTVANANYGYGPKITRYEGQGNGGNYLEMTPGQVESFIRSKASRLDVIEYENGRAPIQVKVVDPLNVPNSEFEVRFIKSTWVNADSAKKYPCADTYTNIINTGSHTIGKVSADSITWVLKDLKTLKEYYPCKSIKNLEEFYFSELGLSVSIGQNGDVANVENVENLVTDKITQQGDFLGGVMYSSVNWLTGLPDQEGVTPHNWIRSGTNKMPEADALQTYNDYSNNNDKTQQYTSETANMFVDPNQIFENVLGGTWAPYMLTAATKTAAAANANQATYAAPAFPQLVSTVSAANKAHLLPNFDLRNLSSVDIVLTPNKELWTRAIVLEECDEASLNPTGARKLEPRRARSVDKQGIALGAPGCNTAEASLDSAGGTPYQTGLGWFPGYAINLETGERLNIAFGEDSYQVTQNGNDMMWNPTNVVEDTLNNYEFAFGGRHYIYVFGNNKNDSKYSTGGNTPTEIRGKRMGVGPYSENPTDPGYDALRDFIYMYKFAYQRQFNTAITHHPSSAQVMLSNIWSDAMWVNIPLTVNSSYNFVKPENMPGPVKVSLRVKKAYRPGMAANCYLPSFQADGVTPLNSFYNQGGYAAPTVALAVRCCPTNIPNYVTATGTVNTIYRNNVNLTSAQNNSFGLYKFNTSDIYTEINDDDKEKSALDLINIVPNPYYGYSTYESNRIDNRVRITNLPNKCKIKIFTLNGTLVRTFDRDVSGQEDILLKEISGSNVYMKRLSYQDWDLKNQNGITVASGLYIIHIDVPEVGEKILKWFGVMRPLDLQSY